MQQSSRFDTLSLEEERVYALLFQIPTERAAQEAATNDQSWGMKSDRISTFGPEIPGLQLYASEGRWWRQEAPEAFRPDTMCGFFFNIKFYLH